MAYVIHFFTSDETSDIGVGLESASQNDNQLSDFYLVRGIKVFVGGNDHLPDSTYVIPIIEKWKISFLSYIKQWAHHFPKLNEVIGMVSKLKEEQYLGISFNETLDIFTKKKLLFDMKEKEQGVSSQVLFSDFLVEYGVVLENYRPHSYSYTSRIRFGPQERNKRVCRFCGKRMPETTFKNDSHTISKGVGNIHFFTNDECDKCNTYFGAGIEQEFINYISVFRTLASRFEGHRYYTTLTDAYKLEVDEDSNQIKFSIIDNSKVIIKPSDKQTDVFVDAGTINYHNVYRALVKYVIGMLPKEELQYFKETIKWINGEDNLNRLPFVKETIFPEPEAHPFINMFFRKNNSTDFPYLIADFHVNHLEFVYIIPGCELDESINENYIEDFLKMKNDTHLWHTLPMNSKQPIHRTLKVSYYYK